MSGRENWPPPDGFAICVVLCARTEDAPIRKMPLIYRTDFAYSVGVIPNFSLNCREKW